MKQQFASDNYSGVCPEAWEATAAANASYGLPYGEDEWTARASTLFRDLFETDCEVFFVFNGTAANSLSLAALSQSYHGVICADSAHVETDECGAPEFFSNGAKLLTVRTTQGKILPEAVYEMARRRNDIHFPRPRVLTLSQSTETGCVYQASELLALSEATQELGLAFHMDGSRFANACAALGKTPAELSWKANVDVLCFGGTKNGLAVGDSILFFNRELAREFEYRCKQAGQLASKMRFLSAPWVGLLESGAWLRNAAHANRCAAYFAAAVAGCPGVELMFRPDANAVFLRLPEPAMLALREADWRFYTFIGGGARFMFSWDSRTERIDELVRDLWSAAEGCSAGALEQQA